MQEQSRNSRRFVTTSLFLPALSWPSYDKSPISFHDRVKRKELGEGTVPGRQRHAGKAIMAKSPVKGRYGTLRGEVKKVVTR
jgi:hypothetical protein